LEIFLGLLNDFSLVEFVDLDDVLLRKVLEALPAKEENLELVNAFAGCHTAKIFQQFLKVLPQSENGMKQNFFKFEKTKKFKYLCDVLTDV